MADNLEGIISQLMAERDAARSDLLTLDKAAELKLAQIKEIVNA